MSPVVEKRVCGSSKKSNTLNKSFEATHLMRQLNHSVSLKGNYDQNLRKNKALALPDISLKYPDNNTLLSDKKNRKNFKTPL